MQLGSDNPTVLTGVRRRPDLRSGCCALVAIKARAKCKSRLADVLDARGRLQLVRAMLSRVLDELRLARTIHRIIVLSPERDEVPADIPVLADRGDDLNHALMEARATLLGLGVMRLLVLPADLPHITAAEIDCFVQAGRQGFALAPDARGTGTNALLLSGMQPFEFRFGTNSRWLHLIEARRAGFQPQVLHAPGISVDFDVPDDLSRGRLGGEEQQCQS